MVDFKNNGGLVDGALNFDGGLFDGALNFDGGLFDGALNFNGGFEKGTPKSMAVASMVL